MWGVPLFCVRQAHLWPQGATKRNGRRSPDARRMMIAKVYMKTCKMHDAREGKKGVRTSCLIAVA